MTPPRVWALSQPGPTLLGERRRARLFVRPLEDALSAA
jgi:hypothetical protein